MRRLMRHFSGIYKCYLSNVSVQFVIFETSRWVAKVASYWFDSHFKQLQYIFNSFHVNVHFRDKRIFDTVFCCLIAKIITCAFWAFDTLKTQYISFRVPSKQLEQVSKAQHGVRNPFLHWDEVVYFSMYEVVRLWHSWVIKTEGMMIITCWD